MIMKTQKIEKSVVRENIQKVKVEISEHDKDEMAIPSYLHSNPLIPWLMWRRYETVSQLLDESGTNALEFGCGLGLFLNELSTNYKNVFAIDLFPQYAQELTKKLELNVNFINEIDEIDDASLDVIVAADVLEHIDDIDKVITTFHRKIKKGGKLIVSGPTENIAYQVGRILAGFGDKGDYHHTNIDNLINDIKRNGFELEKAHRLPFIFLPTLFKICLFIKPDH
jgi:2-polyprenyl-3-methyl-5-hydroxy-6-metoxy-1,4-benzoquinol methylase